MVCVPGLVFRSLMISSSAGLLVASFTHFFFWLNEAHNAFSQRNCCSTGCIFLLGVVKFGDRYLVFRMWSYQPRASFLLMAKNMFTPTLKLPAYNRAPFFLVLCSLASLNRCNQPVEPLITGNACIRAFDHIVKCYFVTGEFNSYIGLLYIFDGIVFNVLNTYFKTIL